MAGRMKMAFRKESNFQIYQRYKLIGKFPKNPYIIETEYVDNFSIRILLSKSSKK